MTLLDVNILLYSYNADSPHHRSALRWLTNLFDSAETIALPWVTLWAFIRIATNPRISINPMSAKKAFSIVNDSVNMAGVVVLQPGPRHFEILQRIVNTHNSAGAILTGSVLAALALENGASLASTDQDFSRFTELRWVNPLALWVGQESRLDSRVD